VRQNLGIPVLPREKIKTLCRIPLVPLWCATLGLSQKSQQDDSSLLKHESDT
jgi:hypothetical protein